MLVAAKSISQLNPSTSQVALLMLLVAPKVTQPRLVVARAWVERHARTIIAIVLLGLGASLMRDGIAGLTG